MLCQMRRRNDIQIDSIEPRLRNLEATYRFVLIHSPLSHSIMPANDILTVVD
jgi:hypothetical protein